MEKLKNCFKNKKIVLMAPGPSLNNFQIDKIPKDYLKSAVNGVIIHKEFQDLDFYFWAGDINIPSEKPIRENLKQLKQNCLKFTNTTINKKPFHPMWKFSTQINQKEASNLGFYTYDINFGKDFEESKETWHINPILNGFDGCSITLAACQILIYLGFTEIVLIGCDCTSKHSYEHLILNDRCDWQLNQLVERWIRFKKYVKQNFPNVEIKIINPIGLKDVFDEIKFNDNL